MYFSSTVLKTAFTEVSQIWLRIWWDDKFGDICTDSLALQTLGDSNDRLGSDWLCHSGWQFQTLILWTCINLCQLNHCTEGWGGELGYWRVTKVQGQTLISCPIELQQQQQKVTLDGNMTQSWQTKRFEYFEIPSNEDLWERKRSGFDAESPLQQLGWPPLSAGDASNSSFVGRLVPLLIEFIITRPKPPFKQQGLAG